MIRWSLFANAIALLSSAIQWLVCEVQRLAEVVFGPVATNAIVIRYGWWAIPWILAAIGLVCGIGWLVMATAGLLSPFLVHIICYGLALIHARGQTSNGWVMAVSTMCTGTVLIIGWEVLSLIFASSLLLPLAIVFLYANSVRNNVKQLSP